MRRIGLLIAAILLLLIGGVQLALTVGDIDKQVSIQHVTIDSIPATIFEPARSYQATVIIAHGFAGSQQLMYPLATTLARHGFRAITFDFPGHGQNSTPFTASVSQTATGRSILQTTLDQVVRYATRHEGEGSAGLALVGHSMGSAAVVEYAVAHPNVAATVGISLVSDRTTQTLPRNLLIATGALEFGNIKQASLRALTNGTAQPTAAAATTYGDVAAGTARRLEWISGVEHISILFSTRMMSDTTTWLGATFGRDIRVHYRDRRMLWVGLIYAGGLLALWIILGIGKLRPMSPRPMVHGWRRWLIELGPIVLTPLLTLPISTTWTPIVLGGYLAVFFGAYGLIQALLARAVGVTFQPLPNARRTVAGVAIGVGVAAWLLLLLGGVAQVSYLNFVPTTQRMPWMLLFMLLMLPYFWVDAAIQRSGWGVLGSRIGFIAALLGASVLRPDVGFVLLILPLFVVFLGLLAVLSPRLMRQIGHPLITSIVGSIVLGWMLSIALPYTG